MLPSQNVIVCACVAVSLGYFVTIFIVLLCHFCHCVDVCIIKSLCYRLSSENVSSPYDDRLDKVDPAGDVNAVKRSERM